MYLEMRVKEVKFSSSSSNKTSRIYQWFNRFEQQTARPVKTRRTVAGILGNFRLKPNNINKQTRTDSRKTMFLIFFLSSLSVSDFVCVCVLSFSIFFLFLFSVYLFLFSLLIFQFSLSLSVLFHISSLPSFFFLFFQLSICSLYVLPSLLISALFRSLLYVYLSLYLSLCISLP